SYMKLHLDTVTGLQFFAGGARPQLQTAFSSFYISSVHAANLGAHFALAKRADLYVGYTITKDTGDGRSPVLGGVSFGIPPDTGALVGGLLASVQTFPLSYQSPLARVSFRISPKLRWNVAYQFYNYAETFHVFAYNQNFRAN